MSDVSDNQAEQQFEIAVEGGPAVLTYRRDEGALFLLHTGVPEAEEGQGIGSRLVRHALEVAKEAGERVVPLCPFVGEYIRRNPEYAALVRDADA